MHDCPAVLSWGADMPHTHTHTQHIHTLWGEKLHTHSHAVTDHWQFSMVTMQDPRKQTVCLRVKAVSQCDEWQQSNWARAWDCSVVMGSWFLRNYVTLQDFILYYNQEIRIPSKIKAMVWGWSWTMWHKKKKRGQFDGKKINPGMPQLSKSRALDKVFVIEVLLVCIPSLVNKYSL